MFRTYVPTIIPSLIILPPIYGVDCQKKRHLSYIYLKKPEGWILIEGRA